LKERLKAVLPDELSILALTNGWKAEDQNALVAALRNGDPTAITKPGRMPIPPILPARKAVARQGEVNRMSPACSTICKSRQPPSRTWPILKNHWASFRIQAGRRRRDQVLEPLKTWLEVRRYIETAVTDSGAIASLPSGKVAIIHDNSLPFGSAIVLGNGAVMVGSNGRGPIAVTYGNAAEALGFSVVTTEPVAGPPKEKRSTRGSIW